MKFTNHLSLPQPVVDAVLNDDYHKGDADYSITELLSPPRIRQLERMHWDELEEDVSDRIWSLLGRIVHGIFERAEREAFPEKRFHMEIAGKRISGQVDRFDLVKGELTDYKFVTLYKIKGNQVPEEYVQQLNSYGELIRRNGHDVKTVWLLAILRDWSLAKSRRDFGYPKQQVVRLPVPLWTQEKTVTFLERRITLHEEAKVILPLCTDEERWKGKVEWAALKAGNKRANKLFNDRQEAVDFAREKGFIVEERPGEAKRCADYCQVSDFCEQWKKEKVI